MTRSGRKRGGERPPAGRASAAPVAPVATAGARRGPRARFVVAAALLAGVAAVLAWRHDWSRHVPGAISTHGMTTQQMVDSLDASVRERDWDRGLQWARAASASRPGTASLLLDEAMAWHNYAQGGSHRWPGRSAMRTSLDRISFEQRASALFDSAEALARTPAEWSDVTHWRGVQYEVLGLPLDALQCYEESYDRVPEHPVSRARLVWMIHRFVRPTDPRSVKPGDVVPRR